MITRKISLILLFFVTLRVWAEEIKPNQKLEMRVYDVSMLTNAIIDYPGPDISQGYIKNYSPFIGQSVEPHNQLKLTNIADVIRNQCKPDSWEQALGTVIEERMGMLFVMQTSEVHTLITQMLATFRETLKSQVVIKGLLVAATELPKETYFDTPALAKVLGPQGVASALASPRLICYNTQRAHIISGKEFRYIRDYDIAGEIYDPVVSCGLEGYVFDARPILSSDMKSAKLNLNFTLNANVDLSSKDRGLALASPIVTGDAKSAILLPIETLSFDVYSVQTEAFVSIGKWMLVETMINANDAKNRFLLLFVKVEIAATEAK